MSTQLGIGVLPGPHPWWSIVMDGGGSVSASENLLMPMDDGPPAQEVREGERVPVREVDDD